MHSDEIQNKTTDCKRPWLKQGQDIMTWSHNTLLSLVHNVLILCYTILFVCCKTVLFCFFWSFQRQQKETNVHIWKYFSSGEESNEETRERMCGKRYWKSVKDVLAWFQTEKGGLGTATFTGYSIRFYISLCSYILRQPPHFGCSLVTHTHTHTRVCITWLRKVSIKRVMTHMGLDNVPS